MADDFRFGIEEEYFLADRQTGLSPESAVADRFHKAAADQVASVTHELLKGQVEVSTKPATDSKAVLQRLRDLRRELSQIAERHHLVIFAAGSQPLGEAKSQETTEEERYQKLENEFGIIAQRTMCCAMHIHVEVPDADARIGVMNRMLPFLPIFLALSVSSPFWQGRDSGLQAFRLTAFREWPRMGLPELFADDAEFGRFVDRMVAGRTIKDASFIWWLIRPSTHFPTIELRVCDSCTRVEDAVAIASLYRCLVRCIVRRSDVNSCAGAVDRAITAENIWQAQRHGVNARLVKTESSGAISILDAANAMLELVREDAEALGCVDELDTIRRILREGTSADRQLASFRSARAKGLETERALRDLVLELAHDSRQ